MRHLLDTFMADTIAEEESAPPSTDHEETKSSSAGREESTEPPASKLTCPAKPISSVSMLMHSLQRRLSSRLPLLRSRRRPA